jgi:hypothetical protein
VHFAKIALSDVIAVYYSSTKTRNPDNYKWKQVQDMTDPEQKKKLLESALAEIRDLENKQAWNEVPIDSEGTVQESLVATGPLK